MNRFITIALFLISFTSSVQAVVNFRIIRLPIKAEAGAEVAGNFFMNREGTILWSDRRLVNPPSREIRSTFHLLKPLGGEYLEGGIESFPAPVVGAPGTYQVQAFNNRSQFPMVLTTTGGATRAFLFDAGVFLPMNSAYTYDLDNPPSYDRREITYSWRRIAIKAISDQGRVYGIITDQQLDVPALNVKRSGTYVWTTPLDYQKLYDLPENARLVSYAGGPNILGTTLYIDNQPIRKTYYNRSGILEEIPGLNRDGGFLNNRDQVIGPDFIYLPVEDYGLPAGLTTFESQGFSLVQQEAGFLLRWNTRDGTSLQVFENGIWEDMNIVDPERPGFKPRIGNRIYGIDKENNILAGVIELIDGQNVETLVLVQRNEAIRATVTVEPRQVPVGEPFHLNVAIKNTSEKPFVLSGVYGESLRVPGTAAAGLEQLENPPPTQFLAPNATFVQRFPWKSSTPGKLRFVFKAAGFFSDGTLNLTEEKTSDEVQIGGDPIKIEFETLPSVPQNPPEDLTPVSIVDMNVQEDTINEGKYIVTDKIPGEEFDSVIHPRVKVRITNVWEKKTPVTAAIQGVDTIAQDRTPLGARAKLLGKFPMDLGMIPYGVSVEREFDLDIRDDGLFKFNAIVTSIPTGTNDQYNTAGTGSPIAVGDPFPVEIELNFARTPDITQNRNGAFLVRPGSSLKILATVKNNTSNSTLNFNGINPEPPTPQKPKGNLFGGILTSDIANSFEPPFTHDHEIPANSFVLLYSDILTDPVGAGSGQITWELPHGDRVVLVNDETMEEREVEADEILVRSKLGSWGGDPLTIKIFQDNQLPSIPELSLTEYAAHFSVNAIFGMGEWVHESFVGMGSMADSVVSDPTAVFRAMGRGGQAIYHWMELAAVTWENMTPDERLEYAQSVAQQVPERAALYYFTRSPLRPEEKEAAVKAAQEATYVFFTDVENAYASQDPLQISQVLGNITGKAALEIATSGVPTPKWTKFTRGIEALRLQTNTRAAVLFTEVEEYLRRVHGPVSWYHARKYWGIGGRELDAVQDILGKLGMKGYARERSPRAIALIEHLKEAIWKPEKMKPKGISEIDKLLLGDEKVTLLSSRLKSVHDPKMPLDIDGITAIFKPDPEDTILQRLANLPPERQLTEEGIKAVLERRKHRIEEYNEYVSKFREWRRPVDEGGGIPVAFNYDGNVAKAPSDIPAAANRAFDFEDIGTLGNPVLIPKMSDGSGILKYITGDVDWIHFSWLDGTPLDEKTAGALYTILSRCCGFQHGETITWFNKGQTLFKGKVNQLGDYLRGKKALLEVTGNSLRAVHIDPALTMFHPDGRSHLIFFDAGTKVMRQLRDKAKLDTLLANLADGARFRYALVPSNWYGNLSPDDTSISGKEWSFSSEESALMIRKSVDGDPEKFNGTAWIPWDISTVTGKAALTPITTTSEDTGAGDLKLEIFDLSLLNEHELKDRVEAWFKPGDRIVIAPGEDKQEIHVIRELGSLILENPVQFDHPAGTAVAVIPASLDIPEKANTSNLKILFTEWIAAAGGLRITWSSVPGETYQIQGSERLEEGNWVALGENITANSSTTSTMVGIPRATRQMFIQVFRTAD